MRRLANLNFAHLLPDCLQILIRNFFHSIIQLDELEQRPDAEWLNNRKQNGRRLARAEKRLDERHDILILQEYANLVVNEK